MRAAAIDVGSNTLRLLVGDIFDNTLRRLHSDREITRLAEGIRDSGALKEENMKRSIAALKAFSSSIASYGVDRIEAVGTSALREAGNGPDFVDAVLRETGIRIRTISGMREAELTAKGIFLGFGETGAPSFIMDIGGGSTEWIISASGTAGALLCGSMQVGVISLFERFVKTDPVSSDDLKALEAECSSHISLLGEEVRGRVPAGADLVGTGGTVTTLASLDLGLKTYNPGRIHMHRISIERLLALRDLLVSLPLDRRQEMDGLEPGRADLIIPGILLTIKFMDFFSSKEITVSDYGLLEGLLREAYDENRL